MNRHLKKLPASFDPPENEAAESAAAGPGPSETDAEPKGESGG